MIEWRSSGARVIGLHAGLSDDQIAELARATGVAKVGIDAPFGWPGPFVDAISSYACTGRWPIGVGGEAAILLA